MKPESLTYEETIRRLGAIVEQLEQGDQPLEQALALFEDGVRLARSCREHLDRAEKRVEELLSVSKDGEPTTRELPPG